MHAKRMDKIATGVLYAISGIIVAILASLILYILVRGCPMYPWHFLTGKSLFLPSRRRDWNSTV